MTKPKISIAMAEIANLQEQLAEREREVGNLRQWITHVEKQLNSALIQIDDLRNERSQIVDWLRSQCEQSDSEDAPIHCYWPIADRIEEGDFR